MAAATQRKNRYRSVGTLVRVASGQYNVTSIRPFWPPTLIQQIPSPRVPRMSFPGKVRKCACRPHTSECNNARMRGKSCPEALAVPEPERVGPKVETNPH